MSISIHASNFGVVARENYPNGPSYGRLADGSWAKTESIDNGHGAFHAVGKQDVPERFRGAVEDYMNQHQQQSTRLTAVQFWQMTADQGGRQQLAESQRAVERPQPKTEETPQAKLKLD